MFAGASIVIHGDDGSILDSSVAIEDEEAFGVLESMFYATDVSPSDKHECEYDKILIVVYLFYRV